MSSNSTTSHVASESPPNRSLFAHFDFHSPLSITIPSATKSPLPRWTGKWHTSPTDYFPLYDDTHPLYPAFKVGKPHVKSVFPEYVELDEFQDCSSSIHVIRMDLDDTDVWSTIAITSIQEQESKPPESQGAETQISEMEAGKLHVRQGGPATRLTIEKIGQRGSIAKKQKDRKQASSGFPVKAKFFFMSIKQRLFRSKDAKRNHIDMIEMPLPESETNISVGRNAVDIRTYSNETVDHTERKHDGVSNMIGRSSFSNPWTDGDIIVKRKTMEFLDVAKENTGGINGVVIDNAGGVVEEDECKSGKMAVFETTISLQDACNKDTK